MTVSDCCIWCWSSELLSGHYFLWFLEKLGVLKRDRSDQSATAKYDIIAPPFTGISLWCVSVPVLASLRTKLQQCDHRSFASEILFNPKTVKSQIQGGNIFCKILSQFLHLTENNQSWRRQSQPLSLIDKKNLLTRWNFWTIIHHHHLLNGAAHVVKPLNDHPATNTTQICVFSQCRLFDPGKIIYWNETDNSWRARTGSPSLSVKKTSGTFCSSSFHLQSLTPERKRWKGISKLDLRWW